VQNDTEPVLPVTPTNEGRKPAVNNFGYNLPFYDLMPLWIGLGGSVLIGMGVAVTIIQFHWSVNIGLTLIPVICAHLYIKAFVENALPNMQRDTVVRLLSLTPDLERPMFEKIPFIPSLRPSLSMASDPEEAGAEMHPMLRMHSRFSALNKQKRK
jgi:hypothetical protein